ncbi:MAG: TetR/AcrR family transcriptional regulator [Pseudomonadota bacterium]
MGRRKNLSEDELLDRALHVFRRDGFARTSADVLVRETGASRYNLYSSYASKDGLFAAALDRYNNEIIEARFGPLEQPDADIETVLALFDFYGAAGSGAVAGIGCLLCNSAVEFGAQNQPDAVQQYFDRLSGAFRNALENAQAKSQLSKDLDVGVLSDSLCANVLGLFVLIRAKADPERIQNAATQARNHLNSLRH